MFEIHTDGSCLGNPGVGGWAAIIVDEKKHREEIYGGEKYTTNNRMELTAAINALQKVPVGAKIKLFTDSSYLKNAFTNGWMAKWKVNGWKTSTKSPVVNRDLWQILDDLIAARVVDFNWVKGHAGNFFNERCDELARGFATKLQRQESNKKIYAEPIAPEPERFHEPLPPPPPIIEEPAPIRKPRKKSDTKKSDALQLSLFDF
ncbi:MAG: ribonuclease HI [Selenomonadaceae bacterium]|nr:ribonuclease HI [Selenomonadaceae bacterium]